ncbi:MAG: sulfide/dihydroorotate dehydrogenase-like FAD/NAD-binding protein [archaeon]|nr:sulfide/dihydroorotate dehydrogenase-like FAD/NAD-binding protein [archaeon]
MEEKQTLKIDNKIIEFKKGQTILQACNDAGIYIPTLCVIEDLTPFGSCRLCTVQVVGARKPYTTACSTPTEPGMEVITNNDELQDMRKDILQMILKEHPSGCLVCAHQNSCEDLKSDKEKTGRIFGCFTCGNKEICELKDIVEYLEITELTYDFKYRNMPLERDDPFFIRDYNLCILCGKCVRICNELRGIGAIHFMNRGHDTVVSTAADQLHLDTNCQFCGACVDICPTGALSSKNTKWVRKIEENCSDSICGFCSVGCGFKYYQSKGELMESIPRIDTYNKGQGCVIGRFCTTQFINSKKRLITPLKKKNGNLVPIEWSEAYSRISEKLKQFNPDEIAVLASPDLSNESAHILNKFASEVLKTSNIATITDENPIDLYYKELNGASRSFESIKNSDWVLLVNANIQTSHPVLLIDLKKARNKGAKIMAINSANIDLPRDIMTINWDDFNNSEELIKGKGTIILGQQYSKDLLGKIINLASNNSDINLIPLRSRGNLEGVFNIIPKSEKSIELNKIKALYTTERIDSNLIKNVEFLIIQDVFESEFMESADIVLSSNTFIEDSGTITNSELKAQNFKKSAKGTMKLKPDWKIISELAIVMDESKRTDFEFSDSREITKFLPAMQGNLQKVELTGDSNIEGKKFNSDSFKYRGEKISNHVSDLSRMIAYRAGTLKEKTQEMIETRFKVLSMEEIAPNMFKMVLTAPLISKKAQPGNFILIMRNEKSERIPITISDWDEEAGTITLYFQERGFSTMELTEASEGEYIYSLVGPLGKDIKLENIGTVLLGGGCYGMGALWPIAKAAKNAGNKVIVILESKNKQLLYLEKEYEEFVDKVVYCTSDGSMGLKAEGKGKIVTAIDYLLKDEKVNQCFFIGCKPMMMEASNATKEHNIPTQVCLNTLMLDGTGMCGACRLTIIQEGKKVTKYACVDGPTFDGHIIDWNELIKRGVSMAQPEVIVYRSHECRALTKYELEKKETGDI